MNPKGGGWPNGTYANGWGQPGAMFCPGWFWGGWYAPNANGGFVAFEFCPPGVLLFPGIQNG